MKDTVSDACYQLRARLKSEEVGECALELLVEGVRAWIPAL